ncbi:MAG: universal stress protein [Acidaminococcaceae bacterium]
MLKNILVLIDGTDTALKALRYAAELCTLSGGELIIMTAVQTSIKAGAANSALNQELLNQTNSPLVKEGAQVFAAAKNIMDERPIKATYLLEMGNPVEAALKTINKFSCDTVVMGNRGFGTWESILKDSVSKKLAAASKVPLIIVK